MIALRNALFSLAAWVMAKSGRAMTLEECAKRMTRLLASRPRKAGSRAYMATLPKRAPIIVKAADYVAETQAERDARRYAKWEQRGKLPSPSPLPPAGKKRRRDKGDISRLMETIAYYQSYTCILCGGSLSMDDSLPCDAPNRASFDHVLPRSLGGGNAGNRLIAHRQCNSDKSNRKPTGCELVVLAYINARLAA